MLEVSVNINREVIVVQLHAVRTKPKGCKIEKGVICTYDIVYNNVVVGQLKGAYGCGVDLAIELLKNFKKNNEVYKMLSLYKAIEKEERKPNDDK